VFRIRELKILITGWYGFNNAGDELLLDLFRKIWEARC
jgi:polysaccharide pyruvyl transferase WcaK-like protein